MGIRRKREIQRFIDAGMAEAVADALALSASFPDAMEDGVVKVADFTDLNFVDQFTLTDAGGDQVDVELNQGAGSGLDADQLDGLEGSAFIHADGSVVFSADQSLGSFRLTSVGTPTSSGDAATKGYVDGLIHGLSWQGPVISSTNTPPGAPSVGDRYRVTAVAAGAWAGQEDALTEWNGASWDFFPAVEGFATRDLATNHFIAFNGTAWVDLGEAVDHGALIGLGDDDHPQYQLRSEAGAALGYASLDAGALVPQDQLGTGSAGAGLKALFDDQTYKAITAQPRFATFKVGGSDGDYAGTQAGLQAAFDALVALGGGTVYFVGSVALTTTVTWPSVPARLYGDGKSSVLSLGSNAIAALTHANDVRHVGKHFHVLGDSTAGQIVVQNNAADTQGLGSGVFLEDVTSYRISTWMADNGTGAQGSSFSCTIGFRNSAITYYSDGTGTYSFSHCIGLMQTGSSSGGGFNGPPGIVQLDDCPLMALGATSQVNHFRAVNCDFEGDGGGFTQDPASAGYNGSYMEDCRFYAAGAQTWTFNGNNFRLVGCYFDQINHINLNGNDSIIEAMDGKNNGTTATVAGARCRVISSKFKKSDGTVRSLTVTGADARVIGNSFLYAGGGAAEDISVTGSNGVYDDNLFENAVPIRESGGANGNQLWGTNLSGSVLIGANTLVNDRNVKQKVAADSPYTIAASADRTIFALTTAGVITVKLPAAPLNGDVYRVKNTGAATNDVTLDGNGKNIDGAATVLITDGDSKDVQYNGTQWETV